MSQRIFIDTQYVVALVNQRDQFHHRANDLARTYDGQPLVTTDAVLVEIGNSLSRRFRSQAIEIIDEFLTSADVEVIHVGSEVFLAALELYKSHADKSWGMTDCNFVRCDAAKWAATGVDARQALRAGWFRFADAQVMLVGDRQSSR